MKKYDSKSKSMDSGLQSSGVMGHASKPMSINVPVGDGWSKVKPFKAGNLGYPPQAFGYKY